MGRHFEGIKQKKSLGQVFLRVEWPVRRVVEKVQSWQATRVLEIGPGGGILTKALLDAGFKVTAVEKDERFVERLEDYYRTRSPGEAGELEIIPQDILKFDLSAWLDESNEPTAVVGNIPYNISSPILLWLLPHLGRLRGSNLLVQLEFAERVAGAAGTKAYGSLSVYTQLRAMVELDCKVDRNCFRPVPKVDSALISLRMKPSRLSEELLTKVELVTRASFTQRRKKLRNAIKPFLRDDMEDRFPIDLNRRAETLRPEEYVEMAKFIFPNIRE